MALKLTKGIFMGTGGVVIFTYGARKYRELVFKGSPEGQLVHKDKSVVRIPIEAQIPPTVKIVHPATDEEGKSCVTIVDKHKVKMLNSCYFRNLSKWPGGRIYRC